MATGALTLTAVKAAKAGQKDDFLWDAELGGFGLKVTPKGKKVFLLRYRVPGRATPKTYTIGQFPELLPGDARTIAMRLKIQVEDGADPQRQKRLKRREAADLAFEVIAEDFIEKKLKREWKAWRVPEGLLRREAIPRLSGISIKKSLGQTLQI
jgi:hypothetical protein